MSFQKKLFTTVGPLVLAFLILAGIFFSPLKLNTVKGDVVAKASNSMGVNIIKGNLIKETAMSDPQYVPFFGSSELSRFNEFHPSVLAEKYHRPYHPFLLGAAGTQSLSHFLMLESMAPEMIGKKAVFVISPQWFVKEGVNKGMFSLYYSPLQVYKWVTEIESVSESDKYAAKRLLKFENVRTDTTLKSLLKQIRKGEQPSETQLKLCQIKLNLLEREDELFSQLAMESRQSKINSLTQHLPETYDNHKLDQLAYQVGAEKTTNNEFQIANGFYTKRLAPVKKSLKGKQSTFDYRRSVEFSDFQLYLTEVAKLKMDVLFVIPPVNARWSDYTGLSTDMLDDFSRKIGQQLSTQGFTNVLDFTQDRREDYFMEDTIHIGWRGWVALDKKVLPFLTEKAAAPLSYQLDDYYFSEEWQQADPQTLK